MSAWKFEMKKFITNLMISVFLALCIPLSAKAEEVKVMEFVTGAPIESNIIALSFYNCLLRRSGG